MHDRKQISAWLNAIMLAMGHGSKREAADILGVSPSGLSKILEREENGFDQKTLNLVAWILESRIDNAPDVKAEKVTRIDNYEFEMRNGQWYWRAV